MAADPISKVIDFPKIGANSSGSLNIKREKRMAMREVDWTKNLMSEYEHWAHLVDLEPGDIALEVPMAPKDLVRNRSTQGMLGICRADAIVTHADGSISIIEAKVVHAPSSICGGIGQLIFYKTLAEAYWGVEVRALVLACPYLPPFVLDTIANVQAPIRFLKAHDKQFSGLVPRHSL